MENSKIIENIKIKIAEEEVARYLGYQKDLVTDLNSDLKEVIDEEISQAYSLLETKGIYRLLSLKSISPEGVIFTESGYQFSVNTNIIKFLENAEYLLLAVVTIGPKMEQSVKENFNQNQYLRAMVRDAIGTVAVKTAGQWLNHYIEERSLQEGFELSRYFEPGSGDWDIQEQMKIFQILQPEKIGVTLNSSYMMQPAKSLSWIRGMGHNLIHSYRDEFSCQYCLLENCLFRKRRKD
ncbi:MAG: hypothetical protein XE02_0972 [Mesotoga infera]|uniref:Vitamin B12 dependent methionine synthase n=1 Tax=Mesotoga infera TaxID=1236046 RepID=A0A101I654_9BACT|nr:MAG: hypothetical protein XE02_0972 [Mesotoga infera]